MANSFFDVTKIYQQYPERLYEPELVTVLTAKLDIRKGFKIYKDKWIAVDSKQGKYYKINIFRCPSITAYTELRRLLENKKNKFIIQGLPIEGLDLTKAQRRLKDNFRDRHTQFMILDFDDVDVGMPTTELLRQPTKAFNSIWQQFRKHSKYLPNRIPQSCWSLSSSYGKPGEGFSGHCTVMLEQPATLGQIAHWFKAIRERGRGLQNDPVTGRLVQPIFTAKPRLIKPAKNAGNGAVIANMKRNYVMAKAVALSTNALFISEDQVEKNIQASTHTSDDDIWNYVVDQLSDHGWLKSELREDKFYDVYCPLEHEHSEDTCESATTIMAPDNKHGPGFRCWHSNTHEGQNHGWNWFLDKMVEEGVVDRKRLHRMYMQHAAEEFEEMEEVQDSRVPQLTIPELQERYIHVESHNMMFDTIKRSTIPMEVFRLYNQKVYMQSNHRGTDKKPITAVEAFHLSDNRVKGGRVADGIGWYPGKHNVTFKHHGRVMVNTWKENYIKPVKGDVTPFLEHIDFLLPEAGEADIMLDFLAHMIQKPWQRPTWAVLHISERQGLGRGLLHSLICDIVGMAGSSVTLHDMIDKPYNDYMFQTVWAGIEEVSRQATALGAEVLKEIITAKEVLINKKYAPMMPNTPVFTRFFFMTNNSDALSIRKDERRFWVCGPTANNYPPKSPRYYQKTADIFNRKAFQAHVLNYLKERDISTFNPGEVPEPGELKHRMIAASKSSVEEAFEILETEVNKYPPFDCPQKIKENIIEILESQNSMIDTATLSTVNRRVKQLQWVGGWRLDGRQGVQFKIQGKNYSFRAYRNSDKWRKAKPKEVRKVFLEYLDIPE